MNLYETDPEFMERFEYFAFEEVPNEEGQPWNSASFGGTMHNNTRKPFGKRRTGADRNFW